MYRGLQQKPKLQHSNPFATERKSYFLQIKKLIAKTMDLLKVWHRTGAQWRPACVSNPFYFMFEFPYWLPSYLTSDQKVFKRFQTENTNTFGLKCNWLIFVNVYVLSTYVQNSRLCTVCVRSVGMLDDINNWYLLFVTAEWIAWT